MKRNSPKSTLTTKRPLTLNKQTIRSLESEQLRGVAGAGPTMPHGSHCICPI